GRWQGNVAQDARCRLRSRDKLLRYSGHVFAGGKRGPHWQGLSQKARQSLHRNQRRLLPSGTNEAHSTHQAVREAHYSRDRPAPCRGSGNSVGYDFAGFLACLLEKSSGSVFTATAIRPYRLVPAPQPISGGGPPSPVPGFIGAAGAVEDGRKDPRVWNCPRIGWRCCTLSGLGGDRQPADALRVDGP